MCWESEGDGMCWELVMFPAQQHLGNGKREIVGRKELLTLPGETSLG